MLGEIEQVLVLSTAHMPCTSPDFGGIRHCEHEHGYIVFVCPDGCDVDIPDWLKKLVAIAVGQRCDYINFDSDGGVDGNLPTWEW